jgi:acyl-CoA thioester hydrolase
MPGASFAGDAADENPQANALLTLETGVDPAWIDYNGHMTEWQYYKVLADAGENFLRAIGFSEDYRLKGYSFFSVQGLMRNLKECRPGAELKVWTEMIGFSETQLHIYQYIVDCSRGITAATGEHMMVHVDTQLRKRTAAPQEMAAGLADALRRWPPLLRPRGLGLAIRPCE